MESIFGTLRDAALIQRTGGGTGFSFSRLRPAGDVIASTGGKSSGPVSFMRIYDCATENIKLGGKRRGANMDVLRVDHPDIKEFVNAKRDGVSFRNFNISVGATDEFMSAVKSGGDLDLLHSTNRRVVRTISAGKLFDDICEAAWATGDPGLIFLDTIARANPLPACGQIEATNPCGELPLLPYESCNLGSINLIHFVRHDGGHSAVDYEGLRIQVHHAVRFLDDVISVNRFPLEAISTTTLANRKIGLVKRDSPRCSWPKSEACFRIGAQVSTRPRVCGFEMPHSPRLLLQARSVSLREPVLASNLCSPWPTADIS